MTIFGDISLKIFLLWWKLLYYTVIIIKYIFRIYWEESCFDIGNNWFYEIRTLASAKFYGFLLKVENQCHRFRTLFQTFNHFYFWYYQESHKNDFLLSLILFYSCFYISRNIIYTFQSRDPATRACYKRNSMANV